MAGRARLAGPCAAALAGLALAGAGWRLQAASAAPGPDGILSLGVPGAQNSAASLAADGARVVVAWAARTEAGTDIYAAFSHDGGASFGSPVRVNDVPGDARVSGEQAPRVALGRGVQVVWVSRKNGIRTARTLPGQETFAPARTIHADNLTGMRGWASLAMDAKGAAHIAWLDGRANPAAAADHGASGGAHKMRQDVFQAVWRPDGTRHEVPLATGVCFCCKTSVAVAGNGLVYVAWRDIYPPNLRDMAVARSADGGRTFGAPVRVSQDGWAIDACPDDGPALAVDARGVVHIAWPTSVGEQKKGIFYSRSQDGGRTFAPRARVDDGTGSAAHPQIALANGGVFVAWDQAATPRRAFLREVGGGARAAWPPRMGAIVDLADDAAVYPVLAAAPGGLIAAWTAETPGGSEIRVRRLAP